MPHSAPHRIARLAFGLLAIWCLGCGAFDSLIQQLAGPGSRTQASCMTANESPQPESANAETLRAEAHPTGDVGCGCTHCVGVEPVSLPLAAAPQPTPETFAEILGGPSKDGREPLVPPPQISSIG